MCFSFAEDMPGDFKEKYRIMCRNGTKVPLTTNPDDECALTVVTGGEVCCIFTWYKVYSLHFTYQRDVMTSVITVGTILSMTFRFMHIPLPVQSTEWVSPFPLQAKQLLLILQISSLSHHDFFHLYIQDVAQNCSTS
jgi:hypothetical protein